VNGDHTLVPHASWTCGMPDGIPPPARGVVAFRATLTLGDVHDVGTTQYGKRRVLDVKGGTVTGDRIQATVQPGGLEFELTLSNGAVELEELFMLRTGDGKNIYFRSCGTASGGGEVRIVPDIEAPNAGAYAFLNTGKFAGTRVLDTAKKTLELAVYDVANVGRVEPAVAVVDADERNEGELAGGHGGAADDAGCDAHRVGGGWHLCRQGERRAGRGDADERHHEEQQE